MAPADGINGEQRQCRGVSLEFRADVEPSWLVILGDLYLGIRGTTHHRLRALDQRSNPEFGRLPFKGPNRQAPAAPTSLAHVTTVWQQDGQQTAETELTWVRSLNADGTYCYDLAYFIVQYKRSSATKWRRVGKVEEEDGDGGSPENYDTVIGPQEPGSNYDYRVRAVDKSRKKSGWTTLSNKAATDTTAPGTPPPPTLVKKPLGAKVFVNLGSGGYGAANKDVKKIQVFGGTASGPTTKIDHINVQYDDLVAGETLHKVITLTAAEARGEYFVRVKTKDVSGNISGYSAQASINRTLLGYDSMPVHAVENMILDPSFEVGDLNLYGAFVSKTGGGTWSISSAVARSGTYALRYDRTGMGSDAEVYLTGVYSDMEKHFAVVFGQQLHFKIWTYADASFVQNVRVRFDFFTASGSFAGSVAGAWWGVGASWNAIKVVVNVPSGSAYACPIVEVQYTNPGGSGSAYFDDASCRIKMQSDDLEDAAILDAHMASGQSASKMTVGTLDSDRLESVIDGRTFQAGSGGIHSFDVDPDSGLIWNAGASRVAIQVNSGIELDVGVTNTEINANFRPGTDHAHSLGGSSNRWVDVWADDDTINTSDETTKRDVVGIDGGFALRLFRRLLGKSHRWAVTVDNQRRSDIEQQLDALTVERNRVIAPLVALRESLTY